MAKKVTKKVKKTVAQPTPVPESLEMPMTSTLDADDVAEDHKVFDMSDIAAPIIEFEMPNLTERKVEQTAEKEEKVPKKEKATKAEKPAQKTGKTQKTQSSAKKETLTAEKLNNELVKLRATVVKSKNQLMPKLLRQKKKLEAKVTKNATSADLQRKITRLTEEVVGLKQFDKDSVAKFAALNTKSLNELKITDKTPVAERLLYKLACQPVVTEQMDVVREKYTEWNRTAAFFMQRLGLQYANKEKKEPTKQPVAEETEVPEVDDVEDEEVDTQQAAEDSESEEEAEEVDDVPEGEYDDSDVEMVDSDEESEKTAQNRRKLLLGLIGVKEDKSRPKLTPKKRKIVDDDAESPSVAKKTVKSMKLEMKEIFANDLKTKEVQKPKKSKKNAPKSSKKVSTPKTAPKLAVEVPEPEVETETDQKTLVMKVDLSKGGKIGKKSTSETPSTKTARKIPEAVQDEDEDDDAAFFLPKSCRAPAPRAAKAPKAVTVQKSSRTQAPPKNAPKVQKAAPEAAKKKGSSKSGGGTGEVHPSWAASQLKKQEMLAAKPCGKKITFGDED